MRCIAGLPPNQPALTHEASKAEDATRAGVAIVLLLRTTFAWWFPEKETKQVVLSFPLSFFLAQDAATGVTLLALPTEYGYEPTLVADAAA